MGSLPVRLRQVAVVARDLAATGTALREAFGLDEPYRDPGVAEFGLANEVYAVGDTFVEVVSPVADATTAGRYLDRQGGDSGYMVLFEVADLPAARARAEGAGMRIVWHLDVGPIAGIHLHPADIGGAIVSLDHAEPPGSWHWAGSEWSARIPPHEPGGIIGLTVEVAEPAVVAERWAGVLGVAAATAPDGAVTIGLGGQLLRFVEGTRGVAQVEIARADHDRTDRIAGVEFVQVPVDASGGG